MNETVKPKEKQAVSRKHRRITGLVIAFFIVILAILAIGLQLNPAAAPKVLVGKQAHVFEVVWLQGQELLPASGASGLRLEDLAGRPLILNFWASWCVSCREEALAMEAVWRKYREQGLLVVGIAVQDTPEAAMSFAKHFGKSYILALDSEGKAGIEYGVTGVPETFFIDRYGIIRHKEAGPLDEGLLESLLPQIMGPS